MTINSHARAVFSMVDVRRLPNIEIALEEPYALNGQAEHTAAEPHVLAKFTSRNVLYDVRPFGTAAEFADDGDKLLMQPFIR